MEFEGIIGVLCVRMRYVTYIILIILTYEESIVLGVAKARVYSLERGIAKFGNIREREGLFYKYFESDNM